MEKEMLSSINKKDINKNKKKDINKKDIDKDRDIDRDNPSSDSDSDSSFANSDFAQREFIYIILTTFEESISRTKHREFREHRVHRVSERNILKLNFYGDILQKFPINFNCNFLL